jgi:hypothetical protein
MSPPGTFISKLPFSSLLSATYLCPLEQLHVRQNNVKQCARVLSVVSPVCRFVICYEMLESNSAYSPADLAQFTLGAVGSM